MTVMLVVCLITSVLLNIVFAFSLGQHIKTTRTTTDLLDYYNQLFYSLVAVKDNSLSTKEEETTNKGETNDI